MSGNTIWHIVITVILLVSMSLTVLNSWDIRRISRELDKRSPLVYSIVDLNQRLQGIDKKLDLLITADRAAP